MDPDHELPISKIETGTKEKLDLEWGLKTFQISEMDRKALRSLDTWRRNDPKKKDK